MEIKVYLHRTKKQNFSVCECFSVIFDFDKLPKEKQADIDFINQGFKNDIKKMAFNTTSIKKYGTGYISFVRPQYEGPDDENGNEYIYFDNNESQFKLRKDVT